MLNFNGVARLGLKKDEVIEIKSAGNGKAYISIPLAFKRKKSNKDGEYESDFVFCTFFGTGATVLKNNIAPGGRLYVSGYITTQTKEDITYHNYVVDNFEILDFKRQDKTNGNETTQNNKTDFNDDLIDETQF